MKTFLQRHASSVIGVLSGFDRVRLRGTVRLLANAGGLGAALGHVGVLLKDFKQFAGGVSKQIKATSEQAAESANRPVLYLNSPSIRKEDVAREIARRDKIEEGLICVLKAVEPCQSFHVRRDRASKHLVLEPALRKCLHFYHYYQHPTLGFMHARVQSWLPFNVHVCINGREWLARQMDQAGMAYRRRENCFPWIEDVARAQELFDSQLTVDWTKLLNGILGQAHPDYKTIFRGFPLDYYWSADESEWATDVMFKRASDLAALYPSLIRHGMQNLSSRDVMRFLGRKVPAIGGVHGRFEGEVVTDLKQRTEGMRIKHRVNENSIKMYDKQLSVLRVETTINNTRDFKVYRTCDEQDRTPVDQTAAREEATVLDNATARDVAIVVSQATAQDETTVREEAIAQDQGATQDQTTGKPSAKGKAKWQRMRKGVSDIHRRAQVCQAVNERYLDAMGSVEETTPLKELTQPLCERANLNARPVRGLNPLSKADATLLENVGRGEFILNGLRNRNLRELTFPTPATDKKETQRRGAVVTRMIRMLRAHGLVRKVPKTHRYMVTQKGRTAITALLSARQANTVKLAAAA
jgi:hypothetical protein